MVKKDQNTKEVLVSFFLRSGLAIVFFYAAISAFLNPLAWIGFIPIFVQSLIPPNIFLNIHSIGNIIIGLWLLSNKRIFYASILSSLAMLSIIIFNLNALDIVFRDITILFAAISLAILSYNKDKK